MAREHSNLIKRYGCLILVIVLALAFLSSLMTCRLTGAPLSEDVPSVTDGVTVVGQVNP